MKFFVNLLTAAALAYTSIVLVETNAPWWAWLMMIGNLLIINGVITSLIDIINENHKDDNYGH